MQRDADNLFRVRFYRSTALKEKLNSFFNRKVYMDTAITACMVTFLVTAALFVVWLLVLAGGWKPLVNTLKFMQVQSVIDRVYVGDAESVETADTVFDSMIGSLGDRWSYYMTKEEYEQYNRVQSNRYVGIGITLQISENGWEILAVADNSPAQRAGIVPGSFLVEVNGVRLSDESVSEVSAILKQDPKHAVVVTADAVGNETVFEMVLEEIYSNPVSYEMKDGQIGYIRMENFDETMAREAITAVKVLMQDGAVALVFDIRNNGGGFLTELTDLLDYLLPEGEIFVSVTKDGKEKITESDKNFVDLPMAVLVNENTYSAAEFFAAALQEYDAATIVGTQTSGKNRSQTNVVLVDGSAVHISSKRYLTPNRVDLTEQGGLTPDVVVEAGENDPQLKAALELLH